MQIVAIVRLQDPERVLEEISGLTGPQQIARDGSKFRSRNDGSRDALIKAGFTSQSAGVQPAGPIDVANRARWALGEMQPRER